MDLYRHLFIDGEFAERSRILAGLDLDQVNHRPPGAPHSIYEELWHLARWQHVMVYRDEEAHALWEQNGMFPTEQPTDVEQWHALVREFQAGAEEALAWAASPERMALETDPGITMADNLASLAVHNAYHFGKIVAMRQQMGWW